MLIRFDSFLAMYLMRSYSISDPKLLLTIKSDLLITIHYHFQTNTQIPKIAQKKI